MSKPLKRVLVSACLAAVTLAVFWQVLDHDFTTFYDDGEYVTENRHVQSGLTRDAITWAFTSVHSANWHPLTWISHMLDCQLYGLNPEGHHLTSLLLHTANVVLLFLILARMTGSLWRSGFVAALFAIHPLHVESVAWISERKDILSTFFWMLTMLAYVRYAECPRFGRYALVVLLFALGLMAKPMLVTLPFVLLLLDYWPLGRFKSKGDAKDGPGWSKLLLEKIPLLALSAASCAVTCLAQRRGGAVGSFEDFPSGVRIANALVAYMGYIVKTVWPRCLAVFYPHPEDTLPVWQVAGAGFLLICVSILAIRAGRRHPYLPVGWLWYLGTLVPVIGLVQVGGQAMADRYSYVPLIGLFIVIAWGIPDLLMRGADNVPAAQRGTALLVIPAGVTIAALMVCTWFQLAHWQNSITLFEHALTCTKSNYVAHDCLGLAFASQGKLDEAAAHYREALGIAPEYASAYNNLGVVLARQGKLEEAVKEYRQAIRVRPEFADAHYNLGKALALQGNLDDAVVHYLKALRTEPDNAEARNNLGNIWAEQGKTEKAKQEYRAAVRIDPRFARARISLASVLMSEGRIEEAEQECREAVRIAPDLAAGHYNLGVILQNQNRMDEAIQAYREAIRLRPDFAQAHNNLALALYDKGDYAEAWQEIHLSREYGFEPHPGFLELLRREMPEPEQ